MSEEFLRIAVTVVSGALAGGLTNTLAIWMLFHPYRPPRLFGREIRFFQGAVPKNQPRLAAAIGRTVSSRLLTEEDLTRTFANREFRAAFDERLSSFLRVLLEEERPSLRDLVDPDVVTEVERVLDDVVAHLEDRLREYVDSDEFVEAVARRSDDLIAAVADEPVAGVLTPAREIVLTSAVEEWIEGAVESSGFREAIDDYMGRASEALLEPDRTFEEVLPLGLVGALERAIASYLPLAIERLGGLLDDPDTRKRFETTIHELLHRFLQDLRFHQRVVARLVMTEETVDRVLTTIEREGAERLSEMLREENIQDAMARGVNDAIVDFLRRPVRSVLGAPDDPNVLEARNTLVGWVAKIARDPATRAFLVEKLDAGMDRAAARTWGDVLERVPRDRVTSWLVAAARSEGSVPAGGRALRRALRSLLDRPIGRPARWLPEAAPHRIEHAIGDPMWNWLQGQVPELVRRIDVARRVEDKVLHFPTARMEELVRKVTDRELRTIIQLGYLLGAFIGVLLVMIDALLA